METIGMSSCNITCTTTSAGEIGSESESTTATTTASISRSSSTNTNTRTSTSEVVEAGAKSSTTTTTTTRSPTTSCNSSPGCSTIPASASTTATTATSESTASASTGIITSGPIDLSSEEAIATTDTGTEASVTKLSRSGSCVSVNDININTNSNSNKESNNSTTNTTVSANTCSDICGGGGGEEEFDHQSSTTTTTTTTNNFDLNPNGNEENNLNYKTNTGGSSNLKSNSNSNNTNNYYNNNGIESGSSCSSSSVNHIIGCGGCNGDSAVSVSVSVNSARRTRNEEENGQDSNNGDGSGEVDGNNIGKPVPNFRVEGSGTGDSSITVAVSSLSSVSSCLMENLGRTDNNGIGDCEQPGSGSGPVSVQSSEEMRLSLVSWYSEPDNNEAGSRECCANKTGIGGKVIVPSDLISLSDKSEEKENKTPVSCAPGICANNNNNNSNNNHNHNNSSVSSQNSKGSHHKGNKDAFGSSGDNNCNSNHNNSINTVNYDNKPPSSQNQSQRIKMHVQLFEQKSAAAAAGDKCGVLTTRDGKKIECPRCSRRSKSGTTTPAAPSRQPRRVVQSSKSTQELKKPIKSILKSDSRGSGSGSRSCSGSGSEKQSSMDSLGSGSGGGGGGGGPSLPANMTRSDSGTRTKFNFVNDSFSGSYGNYPEDKIVSKLKRIEKYATLRLKKPRVKPLEFDEDTVESHGRGRSHHRDGHSQNCHNNKSSVGDPGIPPEMMSKSMSFLEKSSAAAAAALAASNHSSALKRQGSLRLRKTPPAWEPSGTRTSALRLQKMQEAKAKTYGGSGSSGGGGSGGSGSGTGNSGSTHSGSGDSIHYLPGSHQVFNASTIAHCNGSASSHSGGSCSHAAPTSTTLHTTPNSAANFRPQTAAKEKHLGSKIFSKLSSAVGQTTSSNMKRLKQEKAVQTEPTLVHSITNENINGCSGSPVRISPVPTFDAMADQQDQIRSLEKLAHRYRSTALRYQQEFEKSEAKKLELIKQLQEAQTESTEMIDFLTAEKSTLAESLVEIENETKKSRDQIDSVKKESQSRCSSLVRMSEQHKQEALKSQALLNRLEAQSNNMISQLSEQISQGAAAIHLTKQRILSLIDTLLKTYKVPQELLVSSAGSSGNLGVGLDETDLSCSLLLPLITSLSNAFPIVQSTSSSICSSTTSATTTTTIATITSTTIATTTTATTTPTDQMNAISNKTPSSPNNVTINPTSPTTTTTGADAIMTLTSPTNVTTTASTPSLSGGTSLQNLNQAILEREEAERLGLEGISMVHAGVDMEDDGTSPDGDHLSLKKEIAELNAAIGKLVCVVRVIVIHCDRRVSSVASNILQCLKSMEEEQVGTIPQQIAHVQKSLEAWSDNGSGSNGATQCKSSAAAAGASNSKVFMGNGHAHV